MANNSIALSALFAASLVLPFACKSAGDSAGTGDGTPVGSVATPLHGPCSDWPVAGAHPVPAVLSPGRDSPWAIAADSRSVYWTERAGVMSVPVSGGAPIPLARTSSATALAVDTENLYFADSTGVWSVSLYGGAPTRLFAGPTAAQGLAVDSRHVYWTDRAAGTVMRVPRRGGTATVVATGEHAPTGIADDGTAVVWSVGPPGAIETVPLSGGLPETLASGQGVPQQVAADGPSVYWTNGGGGTGPGSVMEVPLAGGTPITLATGQTDPQGIAVASVQGAGTYVYWVNGAGGTLMATPAIGGFQPIVLASGLGRPERIAVGTDSLYWTDNSSGNVMELQCSRGALEVDAGGATLDAFAEPANSSIDDASSEDDASSFACRYFTPDDGYGCTTVGPVCENTPVVHSTMPAPDASSFLLGGSILPGTYVLSGFLTFSTNPACSYPFRSVNETVLFTPTGATSGTTQTALIGLPSGPGPIVSETSAGTYRTSGTTITWTTTCPTQEAPFVGSYLASANEIVIAGDIAFPGADGGACAVSTLRIYQQLPMVRPPPPVDAAPPADAETTVDAATTFDDAAVSIDDASGAFDAGIPGDGGARRRRDGG
jgi:hypothetical protein